MHIEINDKTKLQNIQDTFSNYYPYLTLSFYHEPHKKYESSDITDLIDSAKTIGEIKKTHVSAVLEIQPSYKVKDVENEFQQRLGLSIQIFKKEKNKWEQTTGLDNLSLKDLNILGRNSSDEFIVSDYNAEFEKEENIEDIEVA